MITQSHTKIDELNFWDTIYGFKMRFEQRLKKIKQAMFIEKLFICSLRFANVLLEYL